MTTYRIRITSFPGAALDRHLTSCPPENPAWERWAATVDTDDTCEIVGHHDGIATDDDGRSTTERGGNMTGRVLVVLDDVIGVHGADGLTYTLDWSDVGPVTGY